MQQMICWENYHFLRQILWLLHLLQSVLQELNECLSRRQHKELSKMWWSTWCSCVGWSTRLLQILPSWKSCCILLPWNGFRLKWTKEASWRTATQYMVSFRIWCLCAECYRSKYQPRCEENIWSNQQPICGSYLWNNISPASWWCNCSVGGWPIWSCVVVQYDSVSM